MSERWGAHGDLRQKEQQNWDCLSPLLNGASAELYIDQHSYSQGIYFLLCYFKHNS